MPKLVERIRAVAFDLDGTLVDSAPDIADAANAMLKQLGHPLLADGRIAAMIGGGVDRLVERALAESTGAAPRAAERRTAADLFRREYAAHLFVRSRVFPGVVEGLMALANCGLRLCCVTNKARLFALPLLEAAGLSRHFAFVLCADHRPESFKPGPELLFVAWRWLQIRPEELLCVGDSGTDVAAARAAGCPIAAVSYGYHGAQPIAFERPDWIIGSLAEICSLQIPRTASAA